MSLRYLGGIIKPSYNPLAANVTVSPTVVQTGGVYTLQQQAQAQGQQQWSHDPYFNNTTLLLHADNFANGSQNNTFLVTPPGGVGSYTGSFNGSTQYLTTSSSAISYAGDFTVECWFNTTTTTTYASLYSDESAGGKGGTLLLNNGSANGQITVYISSAVTNFASTSTGLNDGKWHHVAFSRSGSTLRLFIDGALQNTMTASGTLTTPSTFQIGNSYYSSRFFGGYISNFRVTNTAVYTAAFTPPTSPLTAISGTSLLTCQSATFVDNSTNNFAITNNGTATIVNPNSFPAITRNGTPTQGTFTPYGNVWSNTFNGSNQSLNAPAGAQWAFGTGDFTVEYWINLNSLYSGGVITNRLYNGGSTGTWMLGMTSTYVFFQEVIGGSPVVTTGYFSFSVGTWYHIAAVRASGVVTLYVNGIAVGSGTNTTNFSNTSYVLQIGTNYDASNFYVNGFISNVRIVKGTAVYTSNFAPSTTPLTAITNTQLLTCQSNRFIDNSANNYTITANNSPTIQRFAPFSPSSGYSPSVYSGSGYFNGSTDYLAVPAGVFGFAASTAFTVEMWIYPTSYPATYPTLLSSNVSGTDQCFSLGISNAGGVFYGKSNVANVISTANNVIALNQWNQIVVGRSAAGSARMWVNGVSVGTGTDSYSYVDSSQRVGSGYGNNYFSGYITDVRSVKGTDVYGVSNASFTPPAAPLTNIANTTLLTSFTNAGIYDNGMQNLLTTVSNAQVSTSIVKYGSGSIKFNGSSDYITMLANPGLNLTSGDFTIELWLNCAAFNAANQHVFNKDGVNSVSYPQYSLIIGSAGAVTFSLGNGNGLSPTATDYACGTISTGTWNHVAITKSGTTIRTFLNGVQQTSTAQVIAMVEGNKALYLGFFPSGVATSYFNGYIDDFRITKGVARYLSNFTPPQVAMANQ